MKRASLVLVMAAILGCSSSAKDQQNQPIASGDAGGSDSGGAQAGSSGGGAGMTSQPAGGALSGESAGSAGLVGMGGASTAGAAGSAIQNGGGGAGGSAGAASFVCSQVQGLTLTREWYVAGFEQGVVDADWQLKAAQSAYVDEWAKDDSPFWATPLVSPCQSASNAPDRVVFVVLSWIIMAQADWESAIGGAVANIQTKYPGVRRIDLMTIIRGPANAACGDPNAYAESTHIPAALDAALAQVAVGSPSLVHVAPQFAVDACSDFSGTGPHLTAAGNAKLASNIAASFASEP